MKEKIIIDCDPGVDDTLTVLLAKYSSRFRIMALTSIFGNNNIEISTRNAAYIAKQLDLSDTIVAKGMEKPIKQIKRTQQYHHGINGLMDIPITFPEEKHYPSASKVISEIVKESPGKVTIVAIGPLTNIANLILGDSSIIPLIKQIVLMGGSAFSRGNVTEYAEANFYNDPTAANIVLNSGIPIYMMGLDVTRNIRIYAEEVCPILETKPVNPFIKVLLQEIFIKKWDKTKEQKGTVFHDPLTVAWLIDKEMITFEPCTIHIETEVEQPGEGACIIEKRGSGKVMVAKEVKQQLFKQLLLQAIGNE